MNLPMTVIILLQGGIYSMECPDVLSGVAGCFTLPLSKVCQLVQQWVASTSFWAQVKGRVLASELRELSKRIIVGPISNFCIIEGRGRKGGADQAWLARED